MAVSSKTQKYGKYDRKIQIFDIYVKYEHGKEKPKKTIKKIYNIVHKKKILASVSEHEVESKCNELCGLK